MDVTAIKRGDDKPVTPPIELWQWNTIALDIRKEAKAAEASVYQVLDEWGITSVGMRRRLVKKALALQSGIDQYESERTSELKNRPKPGT